MNKKMNFLAVFPLFGSVFLLFWLFIKMAKKEIDRKKFYAYFCASALFGFLSILIITLFLTFIDSVVDISIFIDSFGLITAFILGGYIMNFFTFKLINKKWNDLAR